jgi:hypothetical protein
LPLVRPQSPADTDFGPWRRMIPTGRPKLIWSSPNIDPPIQPRRTETLNSRRKAAIHDATLSSHCQQYIASLLTIRVDQYSTGPEPTRNRCGRPYNPLLGMFAILFTIVDSIVHDLLGSETRVSLRHSWLGWRNLPGGIALRGRCEAAPPGLPPTHNDTNGPQRAAMGEQVI